MSSQIDELVSQIENSFKQLSKAVEHIKSAEKLSVEVIKSSNEVKDGFKNTIETLNKVVKEDFEVKKQSKIAQMVIMPVLRPEILLEDNLSNTERSEKGFGSTGV